MAQVTDIQIERGKSLLRRLRRDPFLAIVVGKDGINIYAKGMTSSRLQEIRRIIEEELDAEESIWQ